MTVEGKIGAGRYNVIAGQAIIGGIHIGAQARAERAGQGGAKHSVAEQGEPENDYTNIKKSKMKLSQCVLAICVLLAAIKPGLLGEYSLPGNIENQFGREKEMEEIIHNLIDSNVNVLTLWGLPGLGKSLMAFHVRFEMMKLGYTAYYIKVENFTDVEELKTELEDISGYSAAKLENWVKHVTADTLLILDNVDVHWTNRTELKNSFQGFVDTLSSSSEFQYLKVLITTQHLIESQHKGKSYNTGPLLPKDCVIFARSLDNGLTYSQSHSICEAVGRVPLAVKLIVKSYLPIEGKTFEDAPNDKENILKTLEYIPKTLLQPERLKTALNLTFSMVRRECQITCLLLYKFTTYFTRNDAISLITPDVMGNSEYRLDRCFHEVYIKSFLEKVVDLNSKSATVLYTFHALVASYLSISRDVVDYTNELQGYWQNYFEQIIFPPNDVRISYGAWRGGPSPGMLISSYSFLPKYVHRADFKCFADILKGNDRHSYHLVAFLFTNTHTTTSGLTIPSDLVGIENYHNSSIELIRSAVDFVITDIRSEVLPPVPSVYVSRIISTYFNLFSDTEYWQYLIYENVSELMDDLMKCEMKIEKLHTPLSTRNVNVSVEVLIQRSHFHLYVDDKCQKIGNNHDVCQHRWKYRLLILNRNLKKKKISLKTRKAHLHLLKGLLYYALMEDDNAIHELDLAIEHYALMEDDNAIHELDLAIEHHCCLKELQNGIAYITLYDIHSRNDNTEGAQFAMNKIEDIYTQSISAEYFSSAYGYIIIPFLWSMNKTVLARKLCDKWTETYCKTYCINNAVNLDCDPYNLYRYQSHEKILSYSFCPKPPNGCEKASINVIPHSRLKIYFGNNTLNGKLADSADLLHFGDD